jgi:hypothetical protein
MVQRIVAPWSRVVILLLALGIGLALSYWATGTLVPTRPGDTLIFQSGLLLIVLGSSVIEHQFTRPADAVVNSLTGSVALLTVYADAPREMWALVLAYCVLVLLLSVTCVSISSRQHTTGRWPLVASLTYRPAVALGRAKVLFSVIFLFAVFSFYTIRDSTALVLVLAWALFLAIWPLGIPEFLSSLHRTKRFASVGTVIRHDAPNLIRVALSNPTRWRADTTLAFRHSNGAAFQVLRLYTHSAASEEIGTGLCVPWEGAPLEDLPLASPCPVIEIQTATKDLICPEVMLGADRNAELVGFVVEGSSVEEIRFESWRPDRCRQGLLVWCLVDGHRVYYQVVGGQNREEAFGGDKHGLQVATATQLGSLDSATFRRFSWLPTMNSPVFVDRDGLNTAATAPAGDFVFGTIPGTQLQVSGPLADALDHHMAILGITGSGKTEIAFDVIRYAIRSGFKVVCVDLTAKYRGRLEDLTPAELSISGEHAAVLSEKLFDAETGPYGGGAEKKILKDFADTLRKDVQKRLREFLSSTSDENRVGIIGLEEISNTKASLFITELFLTSLLRFAREAGVSSPRILVVLEEAHTVVPETGTMGVADYDSRGIVGKIAQIALQGRKYGVGLLVVAQRTATVSKSVLTQCNTIIALTAFDETTRTFLEGYLGAAHSELVAQLPRFQAIVAGKALRSDRPIVVQIPIKQFDSTGRPAA